MWYFKEQKITAQEIITEIIIQEIKLKGITIKFEKYNGEIFYV